MSRKGIRIVAEAAIAQTARTSMTQSAHCTDAKAEAIVHLGFGLRDRLHPPNAYF